MTSDRELLELAARAHGFIDDAIENSAAFGLHRDDTGRHYYWIDGNGWMPWAPHLDDGQALRLATKLHMTLRCYMGSTCAQIGVPGQPNAYVEETDHADPTAATRRAIFRAAAEVGEVMALKEAAGGTAPSGGEGG